MLNSSWQLYDLNNFEGASLKETSDSGFIIIGSTYQGGDMLLLKIDENGVLPYTLIIKNLIIYFKTWLCMQF